MSQNSTKFDGSQHRYQMWFRKSQNWQPVLINEAERRSFQVGFLFKIKSQFYKTFVRHFHKIPFLATGFDAKIVRTYQNQKYHIHFVTFFPCFCIFRCCHLAFMYCQKMGLKWPISFCDERSGISFHLFPKERNQMFLARLPFLVASAGRRGRNNMAENLRF